MHSPRVFSYNTKPLFIYWTGMLLVASLALVASSMRFFEHMPPQNYLHCGDVAYREIPTREVRKS